MQTTKMQTRATQGTKAITERLADTARAARRWTAAAVALLAVAQTSGAQAATSLRGPIVASAVPPVLTTKVPARLGDHVLPLPDLTLRRQGSTIDVTGIGLPGSLLQCLRNGTCSFRPIKPKKKGKALLVLLENGGFTTGLPENFGIDIATCGDFDIEIAPGDDIFDLVGEIVDLVGGAFECLDPGNWHVEHVNLLPYIADITDTALETISEDFILTSGAPLVYDKVVVMQDDDFRTDRVRAKLTELAPKYKVDVHVLSHGSVDGIGPSSRISEQDIREFGNIAKLDLRAVYQMNCFGSELNDAWRDAGADIVNGSDDINYLSVTYGPYLLRWVAGQKFTTALNGSINDLRPLYERVFSMVDFYIDDGNFGPSDVRHPPLFSLTGNLSFHDEFDSSANILSGNGNLRQSD